jgi:hypothetical protein
MDRVDGSLAHHEIQSKKISYILNHYILLNFIYIFWYSAGPRPKKERLHGN